MESVGTQFEIRLTFLVFVVSDPSSGDKNLATVGLKNASVAPKT